MKKFAWLNIFGDRYEVLTRNMDMEDYCGRCYYDQKQLHIHDAFKEKDDLFKITAIHEFLHAAFKRMSYGQSIPWQLEEIMIDQLAVVLNENFHIEFKNKYKRPKSK